MKLENNYNKILLIKEISKYMPKKIYSNAFMLSSVIIPLIEKDNDLLILFIKRTNLVKYHKGEISFPGGMKEKEDKNTKETVLRELKEELGINKNFIKIIGELDDIITITKFLIRPYIGLVKENFNLKINSQEVADVIYIPLKNLLLQEPHKEIIIAQGKPMITYCYFYKNIMIWGASAKILHNLLEIIKTSSLNIKTG